MGCVLNRMLIAASVPEAPFTCWLGCCFATLDLCYVCRDVFHAQSLLKTCFFVAFSCSPHPMCFPPNIYISRTIAIPPGSAANNVHLSMMTVIKRFKTITKTKHQHNMQMLLAASHLHANFVSFLCQSNCSKYTIPTAFHLRRILSLWHICRAPVQGKAFSKLVFRFCQNKQSMQHVVLTPPSIMIMRQIRR